MRLMRMYAYLVLSVCAVFPLLSQSSQKLIVSAPSVQSGNEPKSNLFQEPVVNVKKSPLLAVAYSLILPGLGDIYAENTQTGRYFIGADVALWLSYAGVRAYGHWTKDDAREFAVFKAGASFQGKDDQFEVNLGNFNSVQDYNEAKLRNRQYDLLYDPASSQAWNWSDESDRIRFKDMRIKGDEILRNSQFLVGALVVNRIIGAISGARSAASYNREHESEGGWSLRATVPPSRVRGGGIALILTKEF